MNNSDRRDEESVVTRIAYTLLSGGYIKIMHPDFAREKDKYRFTALTVAYVRNELNRILGR